VGFAAAQDQENTDVVPDSVRQDEGCVDASAEDVEAAGGSRDVLKREIGSGSGLMSYDDESAHEIKKEQGVQASFGIRIPQIKIPLNLIHTSDVEMLKR
jgi:hypothetical protein